MIWVTIGAFIVGALCVWVGWTIGYSVGNTDMRNRPAEWPGITLEQQGRIDSIMQEFQNPPTGGHF